jgi:PHD/YefM family antitoxin component YafN of YafNO toxin-antitoxin module
MSANKLPDIQYVTDANGKAISVIIPIDIWQEIVSERETAYLLNSPIMRQRLLEAKERSGGISFEDARAKLDI